MVYCLDNEMELPWAERSPADQLAGIIASLPPLVRRDTRERKQRLIATIIEYRFFTDPPLSYVAIGRREGYGGNSASQVYHQVLRLLCHPRRQRRFRKYAGFPESLRAAVADRSAEVRWIREAMNEGDKLAPTT